MVPLKRRKVNSSRDSGRRTGDNAGEKTPTKFPGIVLFLLERKMGASRRAFLSQLGLKKGFRVEDVFSEKVTHIISENNSGDEVRTWLKSQDGGRVAAAARLLDVSWYTESMRAGRPVDVLDRHELQEWRADEADVVSFSLPSYACQRRTTLDDRNAAITDALSLLAENAELNEDDGRGVAFRRAAAALRALPAAVTSPRQLRGLPGVGEHSLRVVEDILENGASAEVETTRRSERYKALKILTGIFGVGAKTADRWIRDGIQDLQRLRDSGQTLNRAQQAGLEHYDDLHQPVTRAEADAIGEIVREAVASVCPGARVTLTGGFRRGKPSGHDVDFLLTHPDEGAEEGLLPKVVTWLETQGFLLYHKTSRNSYLESKDGPGRPSSNMDRFDRCLSIFKLSGKERPAAGRGRSQEEEAAAGRGRSQEEEPAPPPAETPPTRRWRAVRVDLVVSPLSQFAFALLGWTGSKLFERELRRWAGHEKDMSLSSHALYDNRQGRYLRASSEEEIFDLLGLEFVAPSERNA